LLPFFITQILLILTHQTNLRMKELIITDVVKDDLPDYIRLRDKVVLSEGAGLKGNQKIGGLFEKIVSDKVSDQEFKQVKAQYAGWNLQTKEEVYYFNLYRSFGYLKAKFNQNRTSVNKTATLSSQAETILASFNTWNFKREQPKNLKKFMEAIDQAISQNAPIPFVLYWGKGEKTLPDGAEKQALNQLRKISESIMETYPLGAKFTLIFTDTHAEHNGYKAKEIEEYFKEVEKLAKGFDFTNMSEICPLGNTEDVEIPAKVQKIPEECPAFEVDREVRGNSAAAI